MTGSNPDRTANRADEARDAKRRAIVLVLDRFSSRYLAPYGNTWMETPSCNQLAAEGLLFEHTIANSVQLDALYRSMLTGQELPKRSTTYTPLIRQLRDAGISNCLLTDDPRVAELTACEAFSVCERLSTAPPQHPAARPDGTRLSHSLAATLSRLRGESPRLTWLHSRGLADFWDAPLSLRERFADEDDPDPPDGIEPPTGRDTVLDDDPDRVQGWVWAYAGQVLLLDHLLRQVIRYWQAQPDPTLLVLIGARGVALGEHGFWCTRSDSTESFPLLSPLLHVPLLLGINRADDRLRESLLPDGSVRSQTLVQHHHLYHTLVDWFGLDAEPAGIIDRPSLLRIPHQELSSDAPLQQTLAVGVDQQQLHLRSPKWAALFAGEAPCRLFLKPDDRWDFNDVADRCPDVVAAFAEIRKRLETDDSGEGIASLNPIDELLLTAPK